MPDITDEREMQKENINMVSVNTKEIVPFHFLLLAVGEVLLINDYVTAQKVQDFIQNDDAFGVRPPLNECRLALQLMENSGFIYGTGVGTADEKYFRITNGRVES